MLGFGTSCQAPQLKANSGTAVQTALCNAAPNQLLNLNPNPFSVLTEKQQLTNYGSGILSHAIRFAASV